ncbi:DUF6545 domain-containing protein [Nocardia pneumoniae]|uniref:DUF6545 domain-containing protein n=1 Tax=Nocardia pneumoniae TaxID=228601 RepID=UPI0002D59FE6|nr:DUF6545 domain-containing protein [Nocardia pneumoniae]
MTSPIPAPIAIPLIVLVAVAAAGRLVLLHDTTVDRLLNRALLWGVATLILLERGIAPQIGSLLHQFSMATQLMAATSLYGAARLWSGADPTTAPVRQRAYDLAGLAGGAIILIAGTTARQHGRLVGQALDRPTALVALILWVPLLATGRLAWRAAVRELRSGEPTPSERLVYGILLATMVVGSGGLAVSAVQSAGPGTFDDPALVRWAGPTFGVAALGATILAVPLVARLRARMGWDRAARYCRRLEPLWRDLTAAVPEIVLASDAPIAEADARLIRMTVEIRDALMHLRHHVPETAEHTAYAEQILLAIETKTRGASTAAQTHFRPFPDSRPRELPPPELSKGIPGRFGVHETHPVGDIDSDLRLLLALARRWPQARKGVQRESPGIQPVS